jgi:signal transduction histidine kinase
LASNSGEIHNRSRFIYKLEGYNDEWLRTEEVNPNITYQSLRAGSYDLCVHMMNDDGTMGKEENRISITIRPPLWRTRWMILLYMLLIAVAAWIWRKWYIKRHERRIEAENLRRETEKISWMSEMRRKMAEEQSDETLVVKQDKMEAQMQQADIVAFIKKVCDEFKGYENLPFKLSIVTAVNQLQLMFDPELMKRAMNILLTNSVRFAPTESRISVGVARMSTGDAQIQVADNGVGVPEQYREHIFDPVPEGEGIQLDKVKAIVDAHHGTIRMEDNPGGGSIFIITLPGGDVIEEAEIIED